MKKIIKWITQKIFEFKQKRRFNKKLKDLQKRDPFIYKH
jgi:predicted translin family RNA/ssDNA-binding protein